MDYMDDCMSNIKRKLTLSPKQHASSRLELEYLVEFLELS